MNKEEQIQKYESKLLIDELSKMPPMVIATAYLHAINYTLYGEDVTVRWMTSTQNAKALEKAYNKGYSDALYNYEQRQEPCEDWYDIPSDEMTLEQARQAVKDLRKKLAEYLEQQPCEDAISRQAVLDCFKKWQPYMATRLWDFEQELLALPPVTPQPKTGHWIDNMDLGYHVSICSNCDWRGHGDTCLIYKPKYCTNCGAKMAESEDKE